MSNQYEYTWIDARSLARFALEIGPEVFPGKLRSANFGSVDEGLSVWGHFGWRVVTYQPAGGDHSGDLYLLERRRLPGDNERTRPSSNVLYRGMGGFTFDEE